MIGIYIASRTVGVPVVGVEYYIGRIDIVSKILQAAIIGIAGYLIFAIQSMYIKEQGKSERSDRRREIE
jgi:hypothetical protein